MKNSINPFDSVYDTHEVNQFFGIDTIVSQRAKLEVVYWFYLTNELSDLKITSHVEPYQYEAALRLAEQMMADDLTAHLETTHHEIKALEYTLRDWFKRNKLPLDHLIHFGITSQDIVDPIYTIAIRDFSKTCLMPAISNIVVQLNKLIQSVSVDSVFVARTHGQPAVPTTMAEQMAVYLYRLTQPALEAHLNAEKLKVKFGGAVGGLSVHKSLFSRTNWEYVISKMFNNEFGGIEVHAHTTQVNGNDDKAKLFADLIIINNILLDFCQDIWLYFSYGHFSIKREQGHVGSSTMAQKNNPIEFENVEGALQSANADLHMMMDKLTRSRGQRDLSDSVVQRFYGLMFAKCLHAYKKLGKAIPKLQFNREFAKQELEENQQVHAEMVQSALKIKTGEDRFEVVKQLFSKKMSTKDFEDALKLFPEIQSPFSI